ncbi:MAG: hypothetical protein ACP5NP_03760 [Acetobacteraceae bacterium]
MPALTLPDEHLTLISMIAIRGDVSEQLQDMLLQGWWRDMPEALLRDTMHMSAERRADLLREAFETVLPDERATIEDFFDRWRDAHDERRAVMHEAWVLSESPDIRGIGQAMLTGGEARRRITTSMLSALDQTFATLLLELTVLYARANEARSARPSA